VAAAPVQEQISEETMLVIAAAVAAYLGERAHIRVVRLVPSHAWAQQGRVSIQASHQLV
jgi:methylmalonyl-CoA carboxyltransferase large subunit